MDIDNAGSIKEHAFSEITGNYEAVVNKEINTYSFSNSTGLVSITLRDSVTIIGNNAFYGCATLREVSLSDSLRTLGSSAFYGCSQLERIVIPNAVVSMGHEAFSGCSNLQSAIIGSKALSIGEKTFNDCSSMTEVLIGESVRVIGKNAFLNCSSLIDVQMGEKIETIETGAFKGCKALPIIRIPQTVIQINDDTFSGCNNLSQVIFDEKKGAYTNDVLTLGSNGDSPIFVDCPLDSVYIGRNISYSTDKYKGYSPFYRNTSLRAVEITDRETEISPNEFYGCTNLKSVKIGDGVTTIGDWAFSGCSRLESFAYGFSVKSIGKEAFSDCTAITSIRSRALVPPVCGSQALDDLNKWNCTLYVPVGYVKAYQAADQWKDFFFVEEGDLVTFPVNVISLNKNAVTLSVNEKDTHWWLQFGQRMQQIKR